MSPRPATDPYALVRTFLGTAELRPEFAHKAQARIEGQHDELGDSFRWASLTGLIAECAEEAADLAAWASLIAVRLEQDSEGTFADRRARAMLTAACQRADEADTMLAELRRLVERAA